MLKVYEDMLRSYGLCDKLVPLATYTWIHALQFQIFFALFSSKFYLELSCNPGPSHLSIHLSIFQRFILSIFFLTERQYHFRPKRLSIFSPSSYSLAAKRGGQMIFRRCIINRSITGSRVLRSQSWFNVTRNSV